MLWVVRFRNPDKGIKFCPQVHPVFWPGNTIAGKFEPEMDMRISLVLIANYNSGKTHITQGETI